MKHIHLRRLAALAAALCALASPAVQAADIVSGSASISNLRYRLVDLDPNDGIAPGLSITPGTGWVGYNQISSPPQVTDAYYYAPSVYSSLMTPETLDLSGPVPLSTNAAITRSSSDGSQSLSAGGAGFALTTALRSQDLPIVQGTTNEYSWYTGMTDPATGQTGILEYTGKNVVTGSAAQRTMALAAGPAGTDIYGNNLPTVGLTLTPNTLLVIEGTAHMSVAADRTALVDAWNADRGTPFDYTPGHHESSQDPFGGGSFSSVVGLTLTDSPNAQYYSQTNVSTLSSAVFHQDLNYDGSSGFSYYGPTNDPFASAQFDTANTFAAEFNQDWALQLANLGQGTKELYLVASGSMNATHQFSRTVTVTDATFVPDSGPGPIGNVPEPSTYALMGLGLAGIALAARRRQQA